MKVSMAMGGGVVSFQIVKHLIFCHVSFTVQKEKHRPVALNVVFILNLLNENRSLKS